jgi:DNA-binding NarL/FixJ family response regulator
MIRVLIADDHELLRRGLFGILKEAFSELQAVDAADARQTLEAAQQQHWDVILLDINMPDRNGLDILPDLTRLCPETPIVMLSAFPEEDYAVRAFKLGAVAYVSKRSVSAELLAAIRAALEGRR